MCSSDLLPAVYDLDIITFWALLRDGVIYNRAQTETGRKWLRNAWRITQTEPETEKLKAKYGERGIDDGGQNTKGHYR